MPVVAVVVTGATVGAAAAVVLCGCFSGCSFGDVQIFFSCLFVIMTNFSWMKYNLSLIHI